MDSIGYAIKIEKRFPFSQAIDKEKSKFIEQDVKFIERSHVVHTRSSPDNHSLLGHKIQEQQPRRLIR